MSNVHRPFLLWAMLFGTCFALILPPFQSPDEYNHFYRAWQISEGGWLPEKTPDHRLGGTMPVSLDSLRQRFIFLKNDYAARTSFGQIRAEPARPCGDFAKSPYTTNAPARQFLDFPNTAIYAPTCYLPQAAAIFWGKNMGVSPLGCLYLCRIFNLLVWALLVAAALRMVPAGASIFALWALLPASLVMAASASADVFSNGLCFWLVAFWLRENVGVCPPEPSRLGKILAFLALLLVAVNKLIFAPLALLFFSAQRRKGLKPFRRLIVAMPIAAVFAAALFWAKTANDLFIPFDDYAPEHRLGQTLNEGVRPAAQLDFVLAHPLFFAETAARSLVKSLPATAAHLVGKFGWEKNYLPAWAMAMLWLAVLAVVLFEKMELARWQRWLLAGAGAACFGVFLVSNYCLWDSVGSQAMDNFQGRYFVVNVLLWSLAGAGLFAGEKVVGEDANNGQKWKTLVFRAAVAAVLLGEVLMLLGIWQRYFQI